MYTLPRESGRYTFTALLGEQLEIRQAAVGIHLGFPRPQRGFVRDIKRFSRHRSAQAERPDRRTGFHAPTGGSAEKIFA